METNANADVNVNESVKRLVVVNEDDSIAEMSPDVEVIHLGYLKLPGEWERLSEAARECVRKRWPKFVPGAEAVTPRLSDMAGGAGVVSVIAAPERDMSVMLCPVGGLRNLAGLAEAERERYGERVLGPFAYLRLKSEADGGERLLDDCEREIARRGPAEPWTSADGRVWGDVVIGSLPGMMASMIDGGLGTDGAAGEGRPQ